MIPPGSGKSRKLCSLLVLAAVALSCQSAMAQQSIFEAFADELSDALDELTGNRKPAARVQQRQLVPAANWKDIDKQRREKGKQRLSAYATAMQDWVKVQADLTPEQTTLLSQLTKERLEKCLAAELAPQQHLFNGGMSKLLPISFTSDGGDAGELDITWRKRHLSKLKLSDEQDAKLQAAITERQQFLKKASAERVANLVDRDLFLSAAQREEVTALIRKTVDHKAQSFSFVPQNYYLTQVPIAPYVKRMKTFASFSPAQVLRAQQLCQGQSDERHIMFSSAASGEWDERLVEVAVDQKKRLKQACEARIAFYRNEKAIEASKAKRLSVAGKGTTEEIIAAWKKRARQQLNANKENLARWAGQNVHFSISAADVSMIENNGLWKETLERMIDPDRADVQANRNARRQLGKALFVVSMLDRELWLTKEQREELIPIVLHRLPDAEYKGTYFMYMEELETLAIQLARFSKKDTAVLTESQKSAYEQVRKQFSFEQNRVNVMMENGGQFAFQVPR